MTLSLATASSGTSYPLPCFLCFFTGGHTPRQIPRYPQSIRIPIIPVSCLHGRCSSSRTASAHPPRPHWSSSDSELSTDPSRVIDHGHNGHNGHNGCGFKSTKIYYQKDWWKDSSWFFTCCNRPKHTIPNDLYTYVIICLNMERANYVEPSPFRTQQVQLSVWLEAQPVIATTSAEVIPMFPGSSGQKPSCNGRRLGTGIQCRL